MGTDDRPAKTQTRPWPMPTQGPGSLQLISNSPLDSSFREGLEGPESRPAFINLISFKPSSTSYSLPQYLTSTHILSPPEPAVGPEKSMWQSFLRYCLQTYHYRSNQQVYSGRFSLDAQTTSPIIMQACMGTPSVISFQIMIDGLPVKSGWTDWQKNLSEK